MPVDPFTNARPYYDPTFPSSGDGFSIANTKNAFQGLAFLDFLPLQPRAHNPPDTKIMVRGSDASSFYNPVYFGDGDQRVPFSSGDTSTFSAPSSNPRIDIVYMTPSGDLKIVAGTEAAIPTLPSLSPSGDSRFPICAIFNKVGQTKIVNFEDKDSNSGDGYIYKDLRAWMRTAGAGSARLGTTNPVSPTGDAQISPGTATTAARSDHVHGGVHAVRVVGQTNIQGDVEFAGPFSQAGNRITTVPATQAQVEAATDNVSYVSPVGIKWHPGVAKAWVNFKLIGGTPTIQASYNVSSITDNGTGDWTLNWIVPFSSTAYAVIGTATNAADPATGPGSIAQRAAWSTGSARILDFESTAGGAEDGTYINVCAFGDQ